MRIGAVAARREVRPATARFDDREKSGLIQIAQCACFQQRAGGMTIVPSSVTMTATDFSNRG
jgi:hypothetical protein